MAKYAFFNMPAYGHVNPTLAVVQELIRHGQQVSYYLTEEFREIVEATGAIFEPYESKLGNIPGMLSDTSKAEEGGLTGSAGALSMFDEMHFVPGQVIDRLRAERPDVIVYDFMCVWAKTVIDELDVPAVSTRATYASNEHFNVHNQMMESIQQTPAGSNIMESMKKHMAQQGIVSHNPMAEFSSLFSHIELLNIVFIPKLFQPEAETFDDRFLFVGPSILPRSGAPHFPFDQLSSTRPLLYISLGSIFTYQPTFYQQCFVAFANQPWQVVLSIGKQIDPTALGPIPENFLLSEYVPQLDILPRTRLFVTHAGTNSIMESMYFGVPMVLIPQQPEQDINALRVVNMGLGILLDKGSMTASTLREAVDRIAHDEAYHKRAQLMTQSVRSTGGYRHAVEALMQFTEEHMRERRA